jgi:ribose transport system permease protein
MLLDQIALLVVLGLLIGFFALTNRRFFSQATFLTIANQIPSHVVLAVGMTYVLVIAGIDLSVGSVLALCAATTGVLMLQFQLPLSIAGLAALVVGLLCGCINGLVTVGWSIPSFIVTLGMLEAARGAAHLLTDSRTQYIGSRAGALAQLGIAGLSLPFVIAIAVVILGQLVLSRTVFGRYMIAVGTNEEAVRLSGVNPRPVKLAVFAIAGLMAGIGAVIETSRAQSANPNAGTGLELEVIAAVVVGGTSLMGGRGSVISSFLGVVIIAVLSAGLATYGHQGVRDETKRMITGCVIVGAALLDAYRRRWRAA